MASMSEHNAWTAKHVEQRLLEAAETLILCPRTKGPRSFGTTMPDPVRRANESYADERTRVRRQPAAGALDRMEECWAWVNALQAPQDRQLLYRWARAKIGRGRSLKVLAMEEGMSDRTLRREINRLCRLIASRLNSDNVAQPYQSLEHERVDPVPVAGLPERGPTHWRTPDARPAIDATAPAKRTIPR